MPPNQAVSAKSQRKINERRGQTPPRREVRRILLKKTRSLLGECDAEVRATREVPQGQNNLIIEGSMGTLVTSALRWAQEHIVTVRDKNGDISEQRFPASPAYERQVASFENELKGVRGDLPDGDDAAYVVAVTNAVLASIAERRIVNVSPP